MFDNPLTRKLDTRGLEQRPTARWALIALAAFLLALAVFELGTRHERENPRAVSHP